MPTARALETLGVFVRPVFLTAPACTQIAAAMECAPSVKGRVARDTDLEHLDEGVRKVRCVEIGRATATRVGNALMELRPDLEQHFGRALDGFHGPDFLLYGPGSFYTPHRDAGIPYAMRAVSVVVFLNAPADTGGAGTYTGGELTFYGLLDGTAWAYCPLAVAAEAGLLVAFRSDTLHEVRPVTSGHRCTIAGWFTT